MSGDLKIVLMGLVYAVGVLFVALVLGLAVRIFMLAAFAGG